MCKEEMDSEFVKIWDSAIRRRLKRGELHVEMDIGAAFHAELESRHLIGEKIKDWRCYLDIMLLKRPCKKRYDLVLMKYESECEPRRHYPAIVAEFKLWSPGATIRNCNDDLEKLAMLLGDGYPLRSAPDELDGYIERPYAYHVMCVVDTVKENANKWKERFGNQVMCAEEDRNEIINAMTYHSQWCRYEGDTGQEGMRWVQTENRPVMRRRLWRVRVSHIV